MRAVAALVVCLCACICALQINALVVSASPSSPETSARVLRRREASAVVAQGVTDKPPPIVAGAVNTTDSSPNVNASAVAVNASSVPVDPVKKIDLSKPGVLKRGILVFGGFGLLALAYFVFYRRRNRNNEGDSMNKQSDGPQFRYGVLQSDDRSDRMELSHMPLTMDSDEDEDEDLEIFDLGQKKKSLSYVNLNTEDHQSAVDDILNSSAGSSRDKEQLLLDIDDRSSDAAIIPLSSTKTPDVI